MPETTTRVRRAPEDFQSAVIARALTRWAIHRCSFCDYPCGFIFVGNEVYYDSGCDCVRNPDPPRRETWGDVAAHYNRQDHPEVIATMDTFWGFR